MNFIPTPDGLQEPCGVPEHLEYIVTETGFNIDGEYIIRRLVIDTYHGIICGEEELNMGRGHPAA
jgi:hypothetical protein